MIAGQIFLGTATPELLGLVTSRMIINILCDNNYYFNVQKDGKHISWAHLTALYDKSHFSSGLSLIPKLKKEHLHLNSYSRMRVNLAAQVR